MIQTIYKILNSSSTDLIVLANHLKVHGMKQVLSQLSKVDKTRDVYAEQVIKLLSVLHYMMQQNMFPIELFQECNIYLITNVLNQSFVNERLQTEMSSSSTFAKSSQCTSQQSTPQTQTCLSASKRDKLFQKRMDCLQTYSDKCQQTERQTIREPLTYQSMLQLYYTYLKKLSFKVKTGNNLIDCYLLENIQSMGYRLIEGQKCPHLRYCFQLIIEDLIQLQKEIIHNLKILISKDEFRQETFEIYQQQVTYGKQLKFYGMLNKQTIDQSVWKQFKKECSDFVIQSKQFIRKLKYNEEERISMSEMKSDKMFFAYERRQLYNQY